MTRDLNKVELLPCPFCGAPANNTKLTYDIWFIGCPNACCTQQDFERDKCISQWNTRATTEREAKLVEALKLCKYARLGVEKTPVKHIEILFKELGIET
jgi:hypothetical protein